MELTSKQRAQLRGLANSIDTIIHVGKDGIGENLVKQADDALEARELIKGRVLDNNIEYDARLAAEALAEAPLEAVEADIRSCGLYHVKAQNIIDASRMLVEEYEGILPDSMEELLRFPGVGRKVANLLLGDIYHHAAVVTDTHCIRICGRLGMYPEAEKNPPKIEKILAEIIEPAEQSDFCHRIVHFGREVCTARAPACGTCPLSDLCRHAEAKKETK